jgi:hypothetical protein
MALLWGIRPKGAEWDSVTKKPPGKAYGWLRAFLKSILSSPGGWCAPTFHTFLTAFGFDMSAHDNLLHFGKHKGKRLGDVPKSYLEWMLGQTFKKRLLDDVRIVLGLMEAPEPMAYGSHPVPADVVIDPMEDCPFEVEDGMEEIDREFRAIVG